jgi:hypothetical protein
MLTYKGNLKEMHLLLPEEGFNKIKKAFSSNNAYLENKKNQCC